jgi:uncharacterized glyoxalase superfamily protein PhnB
MRRMDAIALNVSLTANDLEKSTAWYCDVAGFEVEQRHERDGVLRAVSLRAGEARMVISQDDFAKGRDRVKGGGFSMQFVTREDIDALAAQIKERGGVLETEPMSMPWGARVFRLRDPDGFLLTISSPRP